LFHGINDGGGEIELLHFFQSLSNGDIFHPRRPIPQPRRGGIANQNKRHRVRRVLLTKSNCWRGCPFRAGRFFRGVRLAKFRTLK